MNQNQKNKLPRTGALRSFFKNDNYNLDSQSFLNKSTDGSFYSQNIPQENQILFQNHKKIDDFKLAESFEQQIIQSQSQNKIPKSIHFRNHKDLLDEMSYEDKQKAIFENAERIELLADQNSQAFQNDITKQFATFEPQNQKLVGDLTLNKQQLFELDPVKYQVCSQSLIPKQIRKVIADQRQILSQEFEYLTPVARQNILKSSGHLIDDYYYAYVDCDLYLWKSNMETFRGVNQNINEKQDFEKISIGDRINIIRNLDASYKHKQLKNPIQCLLFIEDHSQQFQPALVVATSHEILLFSFKMIKKDLSFRQENQMGLFRDQFDLRTVVESDYCPIGINNGEEITCLKQCNKTGRIYYASHNSNYYKTYIHELKLYNNSKLEKFAISVERVGQSLSRFLKPGTSFLKEKIIGNRKRLQSVNIQERHDVTASTIKKLIPDAINIYLERKIVEQIQIDQQRNVMYILAKQVKDDERLIPRVLSGNQIHNSLIGSFSSGFTQQKLQITSSLIEIYDLGALGEDCQRICRISQEAIFDKLQPKLGLFLRKKENKEVYQEEMRKFDILQISTIGQSESNEVQLLLTFKNSLRAYIQFTQKSVSRIETKSDIEVEKLNLQFDLRRDFKLTPIWDILALRHLPNSHQVIDSYAEFPYPFQQHIVNKKQGQFNQDNLVGYCNQTSSLIYSENKLKDREDPETNFLKICLVSKNQSAFCQIQELQNSQIQQLTPMQQSQNEQLLECFSLLQIQKLDIFENNSQSQNEMVDDQNFNNTEELQRLKEDEYIIDLKSSSQLGFMQGESSSQVPLSIQKMLGGNYSLKKEAAFGLNNQLWYSSLSQIERQVYEDTVAENQIKILTNLREINIVELRPIDQLIQILNQITQMQVKDFTLATFEEFCDKFGIEEVCCMLLQISTGKSNSKYLQSQKVKQALNKSGIISVRQRSEGQFINPNQSLIRGKNLDLSQNKNNLTNRASLSPYSHRPGQFLSSQKKASQTGQFSKSPISIRRGLGAQQIGVSQDKIIQSNFQKQNTQNLPYYLRQQDLPELYPFVYQNKKQYQNEQRMQQSNNTDSIYKDIFSAKNEINGNCNFVKLEQLKIKEWSHKLLQVYGDSINSKNEINFLESCKNLGKSQIYQEQISDSHLTYRFKAIYLYIQRILRPVWDTYLTRLKLSSCIEAQNSNFECMKPALVKLELLLEYIEQKQEDLIKSQTQEDQKQFINDQYYNFQNLKYEKIIFTHEFTLNIRERLDYNQRRIIRQLIIFIKRCIDSINFIKAFSFDDEDQNSKLMLQVLLLKLSKEKDGFYFLSELSNTKLKDLVLQGGFSNQQTFVASKNQQLDYGSQIKEFLKNSILGQQEVEEFEKSKLVRKLYELTVNFSARKMAELQLQHPNQTKDLWQYLEFLQNLNVTTQQIQGFAEKIQRTCPTFFSDSETVSLIGESLLAQALLEKDKEQQLTLVQNGLIQLKKMPKNIIILSTTETLCKLNCFIEIVEICLVKIKYLKNIIASIDQILNSDSNLNLEQHLTNVRQSANSAISKANLKNEVENNEEQLLECYFTILNLFMAIDQYISELENHENHSANINMLEKIQQIESTNKKNFFIKFFNFWENKVEEKKLSVFENFLKQLLLNSKEPIQKFIQLREQIIHKIEDFGDSHLLKNLFGYIINQPRESIYLQQLPKVDLQSFEDVLNMIQEKQTQIKKVSIDYLFKLMCRLHASFIKSQSDQSIDFKIKLCLLGLTKKICQNNKLVVIKDADCALNQKEKIVYLQQTIDSINILIESENQLNQDQIQLLRYETSTLQNIINHLQFQQKVADNLKIKQKIIERKYQQKFKSSNDPTISNHISRLDDQIKDLKQAAKQCETSSYEEVELLSMIEQYQLRTLQFEILKNEYQQINQKISYNENLLSESAQKSIYAFGYLFQKCIKEVKDLANINQCSLFTKENLDAEYLNCFLQLISYCNQQQVIRLAINFLLADQLNYFLASVNGNEHQCQMILKECMDTINQGSFGLNKALHFGILVQLFKIIAENHLIKPNFSAKDLFSLVDSFIPKDKHLENGNLKIEVYYTMVQKLVAIYLFVNRYFIDQSEQASHKNSQGDKYHQILVEQIKKFIFPQCNLNRSNEYISSCDMQIAEVTKTLVDDNILQISESFSASVHELVQTIDISKKELILDFNQ